MVVYRPRVSLKLSFCPISLYFPLRFHSLLDFNPVSTSPFPSSSKAISSPGLFHQCHLPFRLILCVVSTPAYVPTSHLCFLRNVFDIGITSIIDEAPALSLLLWTPWRSPQHLAVVSDSNPPLLAAGSAGLAFMFGRSCEYIQSHTSTCLPSL